MATKQFAIPLDSSSLQSGDITFKALKEAGTTVVFRLTNVIGTGSGQKLNLKTKKSGSEKSHEFNATVSSGNGDATLSAADMNTIYQDANGGDWDYVEAHWTFSSVDTPSSSVNYEIANGVQSNRNGWPPKTS